jgi:hypothetical protein
MGFVEQVDVEMGQVHMHTDGSHDMVLPSRVSSTSFCKRHQKKEKSALLHSAYLGWSGGERID